MFLQVPKIKTCKGKGKCGNTNWGNTYNKQAIVARHISNKVRQQWEFQVRPLVLKASKKTTKVEKQQRYKVERQVEQQQGGARIARHNSKVGQGTR